MIPDFDKLYLKEDIDFSMESTEVCMRNKNFTVVILVVFMLVNGGIMYTQESDVKLELLIVTGGHEFEREAFFKLFGQIENVSYHEVVQPAANALYATPEILKYDVLLFYDMVQAITDAEKKAFVELLNTGKGVIFMHHALASYQDWEEFEQILGGHYYLQPVSRNGEEFPASDYQHDVQVKVQISDPAHPITRGVSDFTIHDEIYKDFRVLSTVHALFTTEHPESGRPLGWTNSYGASKIVYLQLGHDHFAYENSDFQKLLRQAIEWVAPK